MSTDKDNDVTRAAVSFGAPSLGYRNFGLRVGTASEDETSMAEVFPLVARALPTAGQTGVASPAAQRQPTVAPELSASATEPQASSPVEPRLDREPTGGWQTPPAPQKGPDPAAFTSEASPRSEHAIPREPTSPYSTAVPQSRSKHHDMPLSEVFRLLAKPPAASGWDELSAMARL